MAQLSSYEAQKITPITGRHVCVIEWIIREHLHVMFGSQTGAMFQSTFLVQWRPFTFFLFGHLNVQI